jgi:hypothetical protein
MLAKEVRAIVGERLDVLVSNAGISKAATIKDHTVEDFDNLFATNVRSPFFLVQQLLPILGEGSNIIVISSIGAHAVIGKPGLDNPKAHLPLNVHPLPSLEHVTTSAGFSRAAAGRGSWHWRRNPCMAHESKCRPRRPLSHATLRGFVTVFRAVRGFSRDAATVVLALGAALIEDGNSSLDCFEVRWWP